MTLMTACFCDQASISYLPLPSFFLGTGIWRTPLSKDTQRRALTLIYSLLLTYGTMWQAVDLPPRSAECERALVAAAALSLFDRILRSIAFDGPLAVSSILGEDGGYHLSTTVCQVSLEPLILSAFHCYPASYQPQCLSQNREAGLWRP